MMKMANSTGKVPAPLRQVNHQTKPLQTKMEKK